MNEALEVFLSPIREVLLWSLRRGYDCCLILPSSSHNHPHYFDAKACN